jgi:nitric oxide dioxygenase
MLTQAQIDIVKATAPVVAEHANTITATFYPILFRDFPEVREVFNQTHQGGGSQPKALANAVVAFAANIERFDEIKPALRHIIEKHVSLNISAPQYEAVAVSLLKAIAEVLGSAVTPEVADAWGAAFWVLANFLIGEENQEYARKAALRGGWRGARRVTLVEKVKESDVITSFHFEASDGGALMDFKPGQFLGLKLTIDGQVTHRNYSLSDLPNGRSYRISVKREPQGQASGYLHDRLTVGDEIEIYPPSGDFTLKPGQDVVLITAGVGQTPAIPMVKQALAEGRQVTYLHAALNSGTHAFRTTVAALAQAHPNLRPIFGYSEPHADDSPDFTGFVTPKILADAVGEGRDIAAYVIGPKPFMRAVIEGLQGLKVPTDRIHYEFFGPAEALA